VSEACVCGTINDRILDDGIMAAKLGPISRSDADYSQEKRAGTAEEAHAWSTPRPTRMHSLGLPFARHCMQLDA